MKRKQQDVHETTKQKMHVDSLSSALFYMVRGSSIGQPKCVGFRNRAWSVCQSESSLLGKSGPHFLPNCQLCIKLDNDSAN